MPALSLVCRFAFGLLCLSTCAMTTLEVSDAGQNKKKVDKSEVTNPPKRDERIYPKVDALLEIKGHTYWITRLQYMPDHKALVTAGRDKTLRIWDAASGKEMLKIKDLPAEALALAVAPDGTKLATAAGKWNKEKQVWVGEINFYDAKSGKLLSTIKGHAEPIEAIAFHPKGTAIATASRDGTAKVWDPVSGKELHTLKGHTGTVAEIVYCGDGKWIATGGEDKTVKVWDAATGKEIKTLKGPTRRVAALAFSADAKQLAAGSDDGSVTIWNTDEWNAVHTFKTDDGMLAVAFSPDGSKMAAGGWDKVVKLWDLKTGKELGGLAGHKESVVGILFNPAGDRIISASLDQTVRIWNVASAKGYTVPPPPKK